MEKPCALVTGASISRDDVLFNSLQKNVKVIRNTDNSQVKVIIKKNKIDIILLEISGNYKPSEISLIKEIKNQHPDCKIILINGNGNREAIARAFSNGANDLFRKPYKTDLIVDRIKALLTY